jgi:hypothetical protein
VLNTGADNVAAFLYLLALQLLIMTVTKHFPESESFCDECCHQPTTLSISSKTDVASVLKWTTN